MPILLSAMLLQALFGSTQRAHNMAISVDEQGNSLFGGEPTDTISARTGRAYLAGKRWGLCLAPVIDFFFGKGHCIANAREGRLNG